MRQNGSGVRRKTQRNPIFRWEIGVHNGAASAVTPPKKMMKIQRAHRRARVDEIYKHIPSTCVFNKMRQNGSWVRWKTRQKPGFPRGTAQWSFK
jgi:hypothetical protein